MQVMDTPAQPPPRTSRARVWQKEWEPMPWDNKRRTVQTETTAETYSMQEERMRNKRDAKMRRYRDYQVYYYGSESQKQHRMDQTRSCLKEQLESVEKPYQRFVKAVEESQQLAEEDRKGAELEKEKQQKQRAEMSKYRDNNKMMIELHAEQRKVQRKADISNERQLLQHNPINWSHTLW